MRHAYSVLFVLLVPLILLRMLLRSRRAPEYRRRLGERLGYFSLPEDSRSLLWVHAVSLGETLAARPLIERLLAEGGDQRILVTTTTPTGSAQVQRLFGDRVLHVYAPWDTPGAVKRFLRKTQPRMLVLMETELWPNMLHFAHRAGCRIVLANARLSERSARGYARFAKSTRAMLGALNHIAAQSDADARRFLDLGVSPERVAVSGSIKFDVTLDETLKARAAELHARWQLAVRPVFLVASTHRGEDQVILDALAKLHLQHPDTLLLLAPRHPERFDEVYSLCETQGYQVCRRSLGSNPGAATQVVLLDTLGELLMLFGLAQVAVIGGSFVPNGGHNPLEAAVWGIPCLCGPSMFNFADVTERLVAAGALEQVEDATALSDSLAVLLGDPEETGRRGAAALDVMNKSRGAIDALVAAVLRIQGEV